MSSKDEKLNQLRTVALEKELRKPKKEDIINDAMMMEVDAKADELAHSDKPGKTSSEVRKYRRKVLVFLLFLLAGLGTAGYLVYYNVFACRTHCCDGTCSPSTGPGTCSYHGGVCQGK